MGWAGRALRRLSPFGRGWCPVGREAIASAIVDSARDSFMVGVHVICVLPSVVG